MRRHIERHCPQVHLLVGVDTGHDEEESGSLGAAGSESTQSEDDGPLVLLDDLDGDAEREGHRDDHEEKGEDRQKDSAHTGALGVG